ncbi:MAG TPA: HAMP domain-containing protein [Nitrospirae bacterium]|nr:alkaline phosphatase synthesis sensor protein PhoR [bacterium BMS3Abin06]HDH11319.1 HAMP domain-containing protein [Nitrospirota bacterium]HDZ00520.1 HAMP domain-containing protein [Nitrospirota bacterium]
MSLKRLTKIFKTIGFRITLWYLVIFSLSFFALFSILYFYILSSLTQEDHQAISTKLKELEAYYLKGGLDALTGEIQVESQALGRDKYFVRLTDPFSNILYEKWPGNIAGVPISSQSASMVWWRSLLRSVKKEDYIEYFSSALPDGNRLETGKSAAGRQRLLERFRETFGGVIIVMVILGFGGGILIAIRAMMPLRDIIGTVKEINEGRLDSRVAVRETGDELEELSLLFNGMLQRIEEVVNAMRSALDSVAHDLRTPMTRLRNTAENAVYSAENIDTCREALSDCIEESEQITRMLNTLMDISEAETGLMRLNLQRVNIFTLIADVVDLYRYVAEDCNITIHSDIPRDIVLDADPVRLKQVIANLLDNAVKYTPESGRVSVKAGPEAGYVKVIVEDTGIGIAGKELSRIWDRLYRGKNALSRKGLGLGLSLVRAVVHAHNGHIEVFSKEGKGTAFTISLPL